METLVLDPAVKCAHKKDQCAYLGLLALHELILQKEFDSGLVILKLAFTS